MFRLLNVERLNVVAKAVKGDKWKQLQTVMNSPKVQVHKQNFKYHLITFLFLILIAMYCLQTRYCWHSLQVSKTFFLFHLVIILYFLSSFMTCFLNDILYYFIFTEWDTAPIIWYTSTTYFLCIFCSFFTFLKRPNKILEWKWECNHLTGQWKVL